MSKKIHALALAALLATSLGAFAADTCCAKKDAAARCKAEAKCCEEKHCEKH